MCEDVLVDFSASPDLGLSEGAVSDALDPVFETRRAPTPRTLDQKLGFRCESQLRLP